MKVRRIHHPAGLAPIRCAYTELMWTPILGPTASVLLRYCDRMLSHTPGTYFRIEDDELARNLGVGPALPRKAALRAATFGVATIPTVADDQPFTLEIFDKIPLLNRKQVHRLGPTLAGVHERWTTLIAAA